MARMSTVKTYYALASAFPEPEPDAEYALYTRNSALPVVMVDIEHATLWDDEGTLRAALDVDARLHLAPAPLEVVEVGLNDAGRRWRIG